MLSELTSVTMHLDSLETTVNSTLMNVPVIHVSMEVYGWTEKMTTTNCTGTEFTGTHCQALMPYC